MKSYLFGLYRVFENDEQATNFIKDNPDKTFFMKVKNSDGRSQW